MHLTAEFVNNKNDKRRKSDNLVLLQSIKNDLRRLLSKKNSLSLTDLNDDELDMLTKKKTARSLSAIPSSGHHPISHHHLSVHERHHSGRENGGRWLKKLGSKASMAIKKSIENLFHSQNSFRGDDCAQTHLSAEGNCDKKLSLSVCGASNKQPTGISKSISNMMSLTINDDEKRKSSMSVLEGNRNSRLTDDASSSHEQPSTSNEGKKELLQAPNLARRVRSNSPSYFKAIIKSLSNYDSAQLNDSQQDRPRHHRSIQSNKSSNNNFLTIKGTHQNGDKCSMKSIESTNSTSFSAGFLPSPDVNTPSAQSSVVGFNGNFSLGLKDSSGGDVNSVNDQLIKTHSFGVVALATATIGSSLFFNEDQQKALKQQVKEQQSRLSQSFKSNLLSAFGNSSAKKLTTSSSLMPVKITLNVHKDNPTKSENNLMVNKDADNNAMLAIVPVNGKEKPNEADSDEKKNLVTPGNLNQDRKLSSISNISNLDAKSRNSLGISGNELTVYSAVTNQYKPGSEVLTLISTWIKNAPNDFMGNLKYALNIS